MVLYNRYTACTHVAVLLVLYNRYTVCTNVTVQQIYSLYLQFYTIFTQPLQMVLYNKHTRTVLMILYNRNTSSKFGAVRYTVCADLAVQHVHSLFLQYYTIGTRLVQMVLYNMYCIHTQPILMILYNRYTVCTDGRITKNNLNKPAHL